MYIWLIYYPMNKYSLTPQVGEIMLSLALRVKQLRKHRGISQQEMASRSGVSLGSIKRFETSGAISLESLVRIARVLDRAEELNTLFNPEADEQRLRRLFEKIK